MILILSPKRSHGLFAVCFHTASVSMQTHDPSQENTNAPHSAPTPGFGEEGCTRRRTGKGPMKGNGRVDQARGKRKECEMIGRTDLGCVHKLVFCLLCVLRRETA